MFVLHTGQKLIIFKRNIVYIVVGVFAVFLAVVGSCFIFRLWSAEEQSSFMDYFGFAFICVWLVGLLAVGISFLASGSKQVTINDQGVLCHSLFGKTFIPWPEIADWGMSYCGQIKGEGNTYEVYFSKHPCSIKNDCSKRLKGKMIKTFVYKNEYQEAVDKIVPFCKKYTTVEPFIGVDKFHFLF
jgi:hypothetical protein